MKFIIKFLICFIITIPMLIWSSINWNPKDWNSFLKYMWDDDRIGK